MLRGVPVCPHSMTLCPDSAVCMKDNKPGEGAVSKSDLPVCM